MLIFKDYFDEYVNDLKKDNIGVTNYMIESVNNFETIKGLKIYDRVYSHFEKLFVKLLKKNYRYENMISLQNFLKNILSDCGLVLIYGIGAILVVKDKMSFSSLLTFGALLNYYFQPIQNLVNLEKDIRQLDLVLKRLNELNESINVNNGITDEICKGSIVFSNLNYTYNDKKEILKDINLNINSGEKILILGKSGSGKSTLVKILMKYYSVNRNSVFINNIDINDYKEINGISYISQSENLFTDSLYNNLVLYNQFNANKVIEVSKICELDKIVDENSLGYNMLIEENGFNLSGGERQRIVLARTLLSKFNILIIDEGLNQLDIDSERRILKNIFDKYQNKTILVISHRLENMDLYDRKIVLNNGVLIENVSKV
jgi:ATP-binding cassette subfamily B protein